MYNGAGASQKEGVRRKESKAKSYRVRYIYTSMHPEANIVHINKLGKLLPESMKIPKNYKNVIF